MNESSLSRVGLRFGTSFPVDDVIRLCVSAESSGFRNLWISENVYARSATSTLVAVAQATKKATLGLGVISPALRHPVVLAMEAATIDEVSGGRFIIGLGYRNLESTSRTGSLATIRETIGIMKSLMSGEQIRNSGEAFKFGKVQQARGDGPAQLRFLPKRKKIPIYVGASGPRMQRLACELADGLILTALATVPFVESTSQILNGVLKTLARKRSDFTLAAYIAVYLSDDEAKARLEARKALASNVGFIEPIIIKTAGISDSDYLAVKEAVLAGRQEEAVSQVTEEMVDKLAVAGNVEYCRKRVERYLEAGVEVALLRFQSVSDFGPDPNRTLARLAESLR